MTKWTKEPKETGAYWYKIPNLKADIVWFHNGTEFFIWGSSCYPTKKMFEDCGGMYYGPLDQPPPMPSELSKPGPMIATPAPEATTNATAHAAATEWAKFNANFEGSMYRCNATAFGAAVGQVYKACLAEIEGKTEVSKSEYWNAEYLASIANANAGDNMAGKGL